MDLMETELVERRAVENFRKYLRIKSVQPNPDYEGCIQFLSAYAEELNLNYKVVNIVPGKPAIIMTWIGSEPELPSILLNSHTDVVPVARELWTHDPFAADKDESGNIFGRGSQDMKSVGIQHLEAIFRIKDLQKKRLKRTVHISFVPDEELGGQEGMKKFVNFQEFKDLNVGFALDEGIASPEESIPLFYGQKNGYYVHFRCKGQPEHGSQFVVDKTAEKVAFVLNKVSDYRNQQELILDSNPAFKLGDVTTVNLTKMTGGGQGEFILGFDFRVTPKTNLNKFEDLLHQWGQEGGIEVEIVRKFTDQTLTSIDSDDPWFKAFVTAANKHNLIIEPQIFPAGNDARFIRQFGIPAFGFSPMNHTPVLLHDNDEFLNERIFLRGINIFCDVICELAST